MKPKQKRFKIRQQIRKARRELHQKETARLMSRLGGYNSLAWEVYCASINHKINKRLGLEEPEEQQQPEEEKPQTPPPTPWVEHINTTDQVSISLS